MLAKAAECSAFYNGGEGEEKKGGGGKKGRGWGRREVGGEKTPAVAPLLLIGAIARTSIPLYVQEKGVSLIPYP